MAGISIGLNRLKSPYSPGEPAPTKETRDKIVESAWAILNLSGIEPVYRYPDTTDVYNRATEVTSSDGHIMGIEQYANEMGTRFTVTDKDPSTEEALQVTTTNSGISVEYNFYEGAVAEAPQIAQRLADLATEMATKSEEG